MKNTTSGDSEIQDQLADAETVTEKPASLEAASTSSMELTPDFSADLQNLEEETGGNLSVVKLYRPGVEEEDQSRAVEAAKLALAPYSKEADIDWESLVARDNVDQANKMMRTGNFPTENYPSPVGYYGFEVKHSPEKTTYAQSKFGRILLGVEKWMYRLRDGVGLNGRAIREKISGPGFEKGIEENAKRLGLEKYFSVNTTGELEEDISDVRSGAVLDDILRLQGRKDPQFAYIQQFAPQVDRILAMTSQYASRLHQEKNQGTGELLCNDIIVMMGNEEGKTVATGVRLALPDMRYSAETDALEQKATDLSDLCFSVASAALQTGDLMLARHYVHTVLENYDDQMVKSALLAIVHTRPRYGYFSNRPRLGFDRVPDAKENFEKCRRMIIELLHKPGVKGALEG